MATVTTKLLTGTLTTLLTTELNSMANNALVLSSAFNNTIGQTGDGYVLCDIEAVFTFGSSPTANTSLTVWLLQSVDGTNYEDGGTSVTPSKLPSIEIPVRAVSTAQRVVVQTLLPAGLFKVLIKNNGTGQSLASSGNTLKIRPITYQGST